MTIDVDESDLQEAIACVQSVADDMFSASKQTAFTTEQQRALRNNWILLGFIAARLEAAMKGGGE